MQKTATTMQNSYIQHLTSMGFLHYHRFESPIWNNLPVTFFTCVQHFKPNKCEKSIEVARLAKIEFPQLTFFLIAKPKRLNDKLYLI